MLDLRPQASIIAFGSGSLRRAQNISARPVSIGYRGLSTLGRAVLALMPFMGTVQISCLFVKPEPVCSIIKTLLKYLPIVGDKARPMAVG